MPRTSSRRASCFVSTTRNWHKTLHLRMRGLQVSIEVPDELRLEPDDTQALYGIERDMIMYHYMAAYWPLVEMCYVNDIVGSELKAVRRIKKRTVIAGYYGELVGFDLVDVEDEQFYNYALEADDEHVIDGLQAARNAKNVPGYNFFGALANHSPIHDNATFRCHRFKEDKFFFLEATRNIEIGEPILVNYQPKMVHKRMNRKNQPFPYIRFCACCDYVAPLSDDGYMRLPQRKAKTNRKQQEQTATVLKDNDGEIEDSQGNSNTEEEDVSPETEDEMRLPSQEVSSEYEPEEQEEDDELDFSFYEMQDSEVSPNLADLRMAETQENENEDEDEDEEEDQEAFCFYPNISNKDKVKSSFTFKKDEVNSKCKKSKANKSLKISRRGVKRSSALDRLYESTTDHRLLTAFRKFESSLLEKLNAKRPDEFKRETNGSVCNRKVTTVIRMMENEVNFMDEPYTRMKALLKQNLEDDNLSWSTREKRVSALISFHREVISFTFSDTRERTLMDDSFKTAYDVINRRRVNKKALSSIPTYFEMEKSLVEYLEAMNVQDMIEQPVSYKNAHKISMVLALWMAHTNQHRSELYYKTTKQDVTYAFAEEKQAYEDAPDPGLHRLLVIGFKNSKNNDEIYSCVDYELFKDALEYLLKFRPQEKMFFVNRTKNLSYDLKALKDFPDECRLIHNHRRAASRALRMRLEAEKRRTGHDAEHLNAAFEEFTAKSAGHGVGVRRKTCEAKECAKETSVTVYYCLRGCVQDTDYQKMIKRRTNVIRTRCNWLNPDSV